MKPSKKERRALRSKLKAKQARISRGQSIPCNMIDLTPRMVDLFASLEKYESEDERITHLLSHFVQVGTLPTDLSIDLFTELASVNIGIYQCWLKTCGQVSIPEFAILGAASDAIVNKPLIEGIYQRLKVESQVDAGTATAPIQ